MKAKLNENQLRDVIKSCVKNILKESNYPFLDNIATRERLGREGQTAANSNDYCTARIKRNRQDKLRGNADGTLNHIKKIANYCKIDDEAASYIYKSALRGNEIDFSGPLSKYAENNHIIGKIKKAYDILRAYFSGNAKYGRNPKTDKTEWTTTSNNGINENRLRQIVAESVKSVLKENSQNEIFGFGRKKDVQNQEVPQQQQQQQPQAQVEQDDTEAYMRQIGARLIGKLTPDEFNSMKRSGELEVVGEVATDVYSIKVHGNWYFIDLNTGKYYKNI